MNSLRSKNGVFQKQIPTLLGMGVLVVALVAGLLFFGQGTGVFAPRATPQTTPKMIRVSNVTDKSFTVSFYTDEATPGFVKYGEAENTIKRQMSDDRDQLSGVVGSYNMHHITVSGLEPNTTYYYLLGTGSGAEFDSEGKPFQIKTAVRSTSPPPASKTIYGAVSNAGGTPAEGSVVYVTIEDVGELSSLVKSSGSWAISLANARTKDGSSYAKIDDSTAFSIFVQGRNQAESSNLRASVADAQPLPDITLGRNTIDLVADVDQSDLDVVNDSRIISDPDSLATQSATTSASLVGDLTATDSSRVTLPVEETIKPGGLSGLVEETDRAESTASAKLDIEDLKKIEESGEKVVTNSAPEIKGKAIPNVEVKIRVHSENQIESTVITDENGNFVLDLAELGVDLEPGEHTVFYSYIDPNTGQLVEASHTFYVEDTSRLIAQASVPTPTQAPYGSGNPYAPTSTPTPTSTESAVATGSSATRSAIVSTDSAVMQAGSVGTTMMLALGGLFFIFTGVWSWWLANEAREEEY